MQVADEHESQLELWNDLSAATRHAKSAARDRFGDIFEPRTTTYATRYEPGTYRRPIEIPPAGPHVHLRNNIWKQDICYGYPQPHQRMPKLLVGDPDRSFRCTRPKYSFVGKTP